MINLDGLALEFREKVERVLEGRNMRPFCAVRTPEEQAKLWRQSRSREEVREAVSRLRAEGAEYLAKVLESVGPQYGGHVTDALPGLSWHQWGEAVDCFAVVDGKANWEPAAYVEYRQKALEEGLNIGPRWDWPHVQLRKGSPLKHGNIAAISDEMERRFG